MMLYFCDVRMGYSSECSVPILVNIVQLRPLQQEDPRPLGHKQVDQSPLDLFGQAIRLLLALASAQILEFGRGLEKNSPVGRIQLFLLYGQVLPQSVHFLFRGLYLLLPLQNFQLGHYSLFFAVANHLLDYGGPDQTAFTIKVILIHLQLMGRGNELVLFHHVDHQEYPRTILQLQVDYHHHCLQQAAFFFLPEFFSVYSSPSSPHPGCSWLRSICKQIHSFFSESYFTQASGMQCSRSKAPEMVDESFSSGRSSFMYCDYFTSSQMSARVPTPLGRRAAASLARVKIVTQAGRSFFNIAWNLGFPVNTESFLATGATVTFRPSSQMQIHGRVGFEYLWNSCRRKFSTHQLFLGLTVIMFLRAAAFLSTPLSSPTVSNSSCNFCLEQSQRQRIWHGNSQNSSQLFSSSLSVASLLSETSALDSRSSNDSNSLSSLLQLNLQTELFFQNMRSFTVLQTSTQISFNFTWLSCYMISSSFSRERVK